MLKHSIFLLGEFTRRDFKGRYAGSVMAFLWSFVRPLWSLAIAIPLQVGLTVGVGSLAAAQFVDATSHHNRRRPGGWNHGLPPVETGRCGRDLWAR